MRRLDAAGQWATQGQPLPPGAELSRQEPARSASVAADVGVPLLQAAVTGGLVAGLLTFAAARLGYRGDLLTLWGGVALAISSVAWVALLGQHRRLLWAVEKLTGRDLDRDGQAGNPAKRRLEVHVKEGGHTAIVGADWLGMDDDRLVRFAAALVAGRGLAEGVWAKDRGTFPGGINDFRRVRGKLLEAGLIAWVNGQNPNLGYTLTRAGRAAFGSLAECAHTHTHEGAA